MTSAPLTMADLPAPADAQPSAAPAARFLAWIGIVLGVVYLTVAGAGGFFGLYSTAMRTASVGILGIALLVWIALAFRDPSWRPRSSLAPAMLVCLVALAFSWALSSERRLGTDYVAYSVLLFGCYLLLVKLLGHPFFGPRMQSLGALVGLGICLLYTVIVFSHWVDFWSELGRFSPPPLRPLFEGLSYGNPSTVATVVALSWLAAAAHFGLSTTRSRLFLLVFGLLVAWVVLISGSRGAWAGLAIATLLVIPLMLFTSLDRSTVEELAGRRSVRAGAAVVLLLAAVASVLFLPAVASRLSEPASDTRFAFFAASVRMFQEEPLTGLGPGTWAPERAWYTEPSEADYYIPHAHNIALQTAAELGLVGIAAGLILAAALGILVLAGVRSLDPTTRRFAWASLFALVYLLGHQMFDFYPNMPAVGFFLALSVGQLDALVQPTVGLLSGRSLGRLATRGLLLAAAVGVVVSSSWLIGHEVVAAEADRAAHAANADDWETALPAARAAAAADPELPPYSYLLGLAAAHNGDLELARDQMLASARADGFPLAWLNVARLERDLGDREAAEAALRESFRLGAQSPQTAMGAAVLWMELGDHAAAVDAAAHALAVAPGLASDPYWQSTPELEGIWRDALPKAYTLAPPTAAYLIALEAGQEDAATRLAGAIPGEEGHVAGLMAGAWTGDERAFDELHDIARSDPLHDEWVALCRRVAARSRDADWPHPSQYTCDGAGRPAALSIVRVGPPPDSRVFLPGPGMSFHHQYAYRRFVPYDLLVPGLPHLRAEVP